jgi:sulfide:quinone oxidoreductase
MTAARRGDRQGPRPMDAMGKTILVLGGGVGGLVAANRLLEWLPGGHRVVLVEREGSFAFSPSFLWLMTGGRTAERISRPLEALKRKGIEVVRGEIERIDPERRQVTVEGRALTGDFLIVALGAELAPEAIPGLGEAGLNFYTLAGALAFRDEFSAFPGGRIVFLTAAPAYKCPAAPYEAVMLVEAACRKRAIRQRTHIDLYAAEPGPMGVAGPEVSRGVRELVEARRISYHPEHHVTRVDPVAKRVVFANGAATAFDLLACVPPHRAPRVVRESPLGSENGWIAVDRGTLQTSFEGVYAIGDVVSIPLKLGKPLPKAGVFAHGEAEVVARNIVRAITGRGSPAAFDGAGDCFVETGDARAGFGTGNFYAEPVPSVRMRPPGYRWHLAKVLFEKTWLRRWL